MKNSSHQPIDSDDDCTYTCTLNELQVKHIDNVFASDQKQRRKIKMDSDSSSNSDSDDLCFSTTISSVKGQSGYPGKENVLSPIWLAARTKLQSFAFHKKDFRGEASTSDADQTDSKQEDIKKRAASLLITDCESKPQIPSLVLPTASSCSGNLLSPRTAPQSSSSTKDESPDSIEKVGSCLTDLENEFSDKQKEAILKFLNNSSEDELCDIPGCSLTKAKLLIQHLPLSKWEDLVSVQLIL